MLQKGKWLGKKNNVIGQNIIFFWFYTEIAHNIMFKCIFVEKKQKTDNFV